MTTMTLEGVYDNGVIKSLHKVNSKPNKIYILIDYDDKKQQNSIDLNNLVGVIKTDYSKDYNDTLLTKYK